MSELGKRAIECCVEYDQAKKKIDKLTSKIHTRFTACEERQRKEYKEKNPEADHYEMWDQEFEPCLTMGYNGWGSGCEDCTKAYKLIQERKEARQEFGIAKRRVRAVARSKYKQDED